MDTSSLIVAVMPVTTLIALFTGIALPFIAASRSGRSHAGGPPARADARKRTGAAGPKARPPEPGADDAAPAGYLYVPCARNPRNGHPAQTRRWVQQVPIVKKTAKLIYYTSDSWDRREAVVSPGCISREQFETDTRCHHNCPRDIRRPGVRPARPRPPSLRACPGPGPSLPRARRLRPRLPGRHPQRAVRKARVHLGALPARGRPVPPRIPGRRDPGSR